MEIVKICAVHGRLAQEDIGKPEQTPHGVYHRCKICSRSRKRLKNGICKKHGVLRDEDRERNGACAICRRESVNKRNALCRDETNAKLKQDRKENPEKWKRIYKQIREANYKNKDSLGLNKDITRTILHRANITREQYEELYRKANNLCNICGKPETRKKRRSDEAARLCLDHCHERDVVRGIVCAKCNLMLSYAGDNEDILFAAGEYIKRSKE